MFQVYWYKFENLQFQLTNLKVGLRLLSRAGKVEATKHINPALQAYLVVPHSLTYNKPPGVYLAPPPAQNCVLVKTQKI